jgi:hypothetical protein
VPGTDEHDYSAQHQLLDHLVRGSLREQAERDLARYFAEPVEGSTGFTGRRFDRFAGGGSQPADEITAADVLALSLLSVERRLGRMAIAVLETKGEQINGLLRQIPGTALHEVSAEARATTLGRGSPAWRLWELVAGAGGGSWRVTAYKLMARKRPALFPPFDAMVARALGVSLLAFDPWDCLWQWFHYDSSRAGAVRDLRAAVGGISDISLLRCLDVVLWVRERNSAGAARGPM